MTVRLLIETLHLATFRFVFRNAMRLVAAGGSWRSTLLASVDPQEGERILDVSAGGWKSTAALARKFPQTRFVTLDRGACAPRMPAHAESKCSNLEVVTLAGGRIECPSQTFDKIVSALALHPLAPKEKLALLRELLRVLRPGGLLHIVDYDRPQTAREGAVF